MNAGTHAGAPSEKRVDQRMTGRNQLGVGMGRKLGLGMLGVVGKSPVLKFLMSYAVLWLHQLALALYTEGKYACSPK